MPTDGSSSAELPPRLARSGLLSMLVFGVVAGTVEGAGWLLGVDDAWVNEVVLGGALASGYLASGAFLRWTWTRWAAAAPHGSTRSDDVPAPDRLGPWS